MALQFGNGTHLEDRNQLGIGKFGMGLPNASISQCRRVDVWTWQKGNVIHSYLDMDEIEQGSLREVPEPTKTEIPAPWLQRIREKVEPHGTLVVWSRLDRITWKGSKAFLDNAEFLVGRMYRYFIKEKKATIRLATFDAESAAPATDRNVRPNDPLYLMSETCAPAPFDKEPAFEQFGEPETIPVEFRGRRYKVKATFSIVRRPVRDLGGNSAISKDAAKNQGVSVVRAGRELEMNSSFDTHYDPRDRWWGVEVSFPPDLDDLFGVTNTKQAATYFMYRKLEEDAKLENLSPEEYKELLRDADDPRLPLYVLSELIYSRLRTIRDQIERMARGTRRAQDGTPSPGSAEEIATRVTTERRDRFGDRGKSDADESLPSQERARELALELESEGMTEKDASTLADGYVKRNIKFMFQEAEVPGGAVFDVRLKAGVLIIYINTKHPAHQHLFDLLKNEQDDENTSPALKALKLLLAAWARMEDLAGDERRQQLEDTRTDWGRLARDFLLEVK